MRRREITVALMFMLVLGLESGTKSYAKDAGGGDLTVITGGSKESVHIRSTRFF